MKLFGLSASVASLALVLPLLSGCSGSGSGASDSGTMYIETCSLGCGSGAGGFQVTCSFVQAALNQELSVTFSEPVAPSSINSQTFQLIGAVAGQVPVGTRFVDPSDPRKVIFRPSITFDDEGTATYGFETNTTYRITIPGTEQNDPGPFIRSTGGKPNKSRMLCDILTTDDVVDAVPGQPTVEIFVDQAIVATPDPDDVIEDVPASGAIDVSVNSQITFVFNDVMSPATLANPVTQQPAFITIEVDADGNVLTTDDQDALFGNYVVDIDLNLLQTTMVFTSPLGLPGGGSPILHPIPRKVVITLPESVRDLAGNSLQNTGTIAFTPEVIDLDPAILPDADGENFTDADNLDADLSGADWGGGRLTRGYGGGSGRLGALYVRPGQTVTLNTDSQTFPLGPDQGETSLPDILDNYVPPLDPNDPDPTLTVTDGQFEFSSVVIDPGGILRLTGSKPARVLSRGPVSIFGNARLDVRGTTPVEHDSSLGFGQTGAAGGPAGGKGGDGGDRNESFGTNLIGLPFPGGIDIGGDNAPTPVQLDGQPGGGIGGNTTLAAGPGGVHFPASFPTSLEVLNGLQTTHHGSPLSLCFSTQVGGPGGGGAYSTDGQVAVPASTSLTTWSGASTLPSPTQGGDAFQVNLEAPDPQSQHTVRKLTWDLGFLRGGAGGGGGGAHLYGTWTGGSESFAPFCQDEGGLTAGIGTGATGYIYPFRDHSGSAGGGGGGAVQLISGKEMNLGGQVLATGGSGGSSILIDPDPPTEFARRIRASPGGGGSGGAVKLQALTLFIDSTPGNPQIVIDGGSGGTNTLGAFGGMGGVGLVRLEDTSGNISRASESPKIAPFDPDHINAVTGLVESEEWVSVGNWTRPRKRPESYSGAVSCWMRPTGNFFLLEFGEDVPLGTTPESKGWNMDVIYDDGSGEELLAYRGFDPDSPFANDLETVVGNQLNHGLPDGTGSYFAVRFQGAVANGALLDPCDVPLSGENSEITVGSLTPWVRHPAELNELAPRPNMVRFTVVFDFSLVVPNSVPSFIKGVTNLRINTQPD